MGELTTKLWPIIKREYLERVRTRWFLIATVFAPLIFAIILIVPARLSRPTASLPSLSNITIIDATATGLGTRVALNLASPTAHVFPQVRQISPDSIATVERYTSAVMELRLDGYLLIDSATLRGRSARYVSRHHGSPLEVQTLTHAIRDAVLATRLADRGLSGEQIDSLTPSALTVTTERINDQDHDTNNPFKLVLAAFVAFFLYMSIVLFGQSMLSGVMEEKMTRVSEIVLSSVRPSTLLAGKVIGISAVGLTQQAIWLLGSATLVALRTTIFGPQPKSEAITALTDAALHVSPPWLALVVLFFLLGFTFFGSLYAAVGATVNSESEARQAAQPVMLVLVMTVVLIQPVLSDPSGTLARTLSIIPFSAPILMPLRMSISSVPATEIAASVCILILSCAAAVWVAARIYRVALLMYGKRPTLREVGRWIREG